MSFLGQLRLQDYFASRLVLFVEVDSLLNFMETISFLYYGCQVGLIKRLGAFHEVSECFWGFFVQKIRKQK
jgi:hypothetical protein